MRSQGIMYFKVYVLRSCLWSPLWWPGRGCRSGNPSARKNVNFESENMVSTVLFLYLPVKVSCIINFLFYLQCWVCPNKDMLELENVWQIRIVFACWWSAWTQCLDLDYGFIVVELSLSSVFLFGSWWLKIQRPKNKR